MQLHTAAATPNFRCLIDGLDDNSYSNLSESQIEKLFIPFDDVLQVNQFNSANAYKHNETKVIAYVSSRAHTFHQKPTVNFTQKPDPCKFLQYDLSPCNRSSTFYDCVIEVTASADHHVKTCENGYIYDKYLYGETIVTEVTCFS